MKMNLTNQNIAAAQTAEGFSLLSPSVGTTEEFGAAFAALLKNEPVLPRFIALYGDLGVGKTALTRGFTGEAVPGAAVKSPTYTLVNEYRKNGATPVFHFDMYRITGEEDLESIGFFDYLDHPGYFLVEWSEQIPWALPAVRWQITLEKCPEDPDTRKITLRLIGTERNNG